MWFYLVYMENLYQLLGRIPHDASTSVKCLSGFRAMLRLQSNAWPDSARRFDFDQMLERIPRDAPTSIKCLSGFRATL